MFEIAVLLCSLVWLVCGVTATLMMDRPAGSVSILLGCALILLGPIALMFALATLS